MDEAPTARSAADRLREVVGNLLDNALRVASIGEARHPRSTRPHHHRALGGEQAHIFEPFARGSAASGEGAGLGPAIARAVAEAHGGRLGVRSTPGMGATFRLELPACAAPSEEAMAGLG